jgi:hypothetical protein
LRSIGLSAEELRRKSPAEAVREIAVALQGYSNDGEASRVKTVLLGRSTKELAGYLNDLAEAGQLNATVTTEQAQEAEKFNKSLFELQTNVSNATRSLVAEMIPAINEYIATVKRAKADGGRTFWQELSAELASVRFSLAVQNVQDLAEAVERNPGNATYIELLDLARKKADELGRAAAGANEQLKATLGAPLPKPEAGGGRGFVNPETVKPRISPIEPKSAKPQISEAMRYLQQLDKQIEKTQELSTYEQALRDIQANRLDGITPKLRADILARAQQLDLSERQKKSDDYATEARRANVAAAIEAVNAAKKGNDELEREVQAIGLTEAALVDLELARINETIARKEATIAGREETEQQLAINAALREEIAQLERRKQLLVTKVERSSAVEAASQAVDDVSQRARERLSDSVEEGLLNGFRRSRSIADIFLDELKAQFGKTVLRPIIEPVVAGGNSLISQLFQSIGSYFTSGTTIDPSGYGMTSGGQSLPTRGGRANGGGVREGMAYRVGENGPEVFVPDGNGRIVPGSHLKSGGGQSLVYSPTIHVNGDVGPQTVQMVQAMLARNNQQLLRSMRTGGAFSSS